MLLIKMSLLSLVKVAKNAWRQNIHGGIKYMDAKNNGGIRNGGIKVMEAFNHGGILSWGIKYGGIKS